MHVDTRRTSGAAVSVAYRDGLHYLWKCFSIFRSGCNVLIVFQSPSAAKQQGEAGRFAADGYRATIFRKSISSGYVCMNTHLLSPLVRELLDTSRDAYALIDSGSMRLLDWNSAFSRICAAAPESGASLDSSVLPAGLKKFVLDQKALFEKGETAGQQLWRQLPGGNGLSAMAVQDG